MSKIIICVFLLACNGAYAMECSQFNSLAPHIVSHEQVLQTNASSRQKDVYKQ